MGENKKSCLNCFNIVTCCFLKVVTEGNELRTRPPIVTRFLFSPYDIADVCLYFDSDEEKES